MSKHDTDVLDEEIVVPSDEKTNVATDSEEVALSVKKRSRIPLYAFAAVTLLILIGGAAWFYYSRQFVTTDDAHLEGYITLVTPRISARVTKIYVTENQFVRRGDLLLELETREAEAKLAQAEASLQTALANREKALANVNLTRVTSRADIAQATSNLETAQRVIAQSRLASNTRKDSVEQARTQAQTTEAGFRQAQSQVPAAVAAVEQAKAQVAAAKNQLEVAQAENNRDQTLFNSGIIARQKLEQSGRELSQARANLVSVEKQVDIAEARLDAVKKQIDVENSRLREAQINISAAENSYRQSVGEIDLSASTAKESASRLQGTQTLPEKVAVGESDIALADAEIARARAAVQQVEIELQQAKIYAPQDGYISQRAVQEGQLVQPEQALMTVTQNGIWVIANFKETQIEKIREGQPVEIRIDAYPSSTFRGRIDSFQAGTGSRFSVLPSDTATGNYVKVVQRIPVKIVFDEMPNAAKYRLVPGMSVVPRVHLK